FFYVRFGSALNFDSLSITRREDLATASLELFKTNPLTGIGLNNFIPRLVNLPTIVGPNRFLQPVHNIFLLTLSETGIIGSIGLLLLIVFPLIKLWSKRSEPFSKLLLGLWATIIFLGMFDHYFLTSPQGLRLLFLIWGLSFARHL
ncbi:O-antigen ligase family protein, partial [Candidatus Daviesbacteria bacterium]|nr:O-antigen ligase family protein [Candidatus Daviesbacteria bacterium]